jgi:hypothetical protein
VVAAYQNFLTNLVTAQGYYVNPVIQMLLSNFVGFEDSQKILEQTGSFQSEQITQVLKNRFILSQNRQMKLLVPFF